MDGGATLAAEVARDGRSDAGISLSWNTCCGVLSALDVMQRGDVVWMDLSTDAGYAYGWGTILSLPFALDGIVPMLQAVVSA